MNSYVIPGTTVIDNVCNRLGLNDVFLSGSSGYLHQQNVNIEQKIIYVEYFNDLIIL